MTIEQFHQLWDAERRRMQECGRAFCAELRRQEDLIREILPVLRDAFRRRREIGHGETKH
jgi:hypothetical protein